MKILLAIDGSSGSEAAIEEIIRRPWPTNTEVKVLSVAYAFPFFTDPIFFGAAMHMESLREEQQRAPQNVQKAAGDIRSKAPGLTVIEAVKEGSAKECIVEEADAWGADLIVLGAQSHGIKRFLLGSVALAVVLHAPCSVEVVRRRENPER